VARFGIEEEFVLLDSQSLVPLTMLDGTREAITAGAPGGSVTAEFLTSQFESVTEPATTLANAEVQLRRLRGLLGAHATPLHAIAAASGTPFASTRTPKVSSSPHYETVAAQLGHITRGHEVNGLHVHVEVLDPEERIRALNRVRGWLPVLLALTGNSPFADGLPSGFASWRSIVIRRLPASWCPPRFHDLSDYRAHIEQLLALGAISEPSSVSWAARISERYPTIEVRVCDVQLDVESTLFATALTRAIVLSDDGRVAPGEMDGIDASLWMAARYGMDARTVDPTTGEVADAWTVAAHLLEATRPALEDLGDAEFVADHLERIRLDGTGAQRQMRAYAEEGLLGLAELYREGTPIAVP
jgi:carboxylate-amine ligase